MRKSDFNLFEQSSFNLPKKSASFVLALFLFLNVLNPVFANDEGAEVASETPPSDSVESSAVVSGEGETQEVQSDPLTGGEQSDEAAVSLESTSESQALLGQSGSVSESNSETNISRPNVIDSTGALHYEYPLLMPSGRKGLFPALSISYDSSNSGDTIFGRGWNINIPFIQRQNKRGIDKLYTENHFVSSLDGELIDQGGGIYTPRTENGSFLRYQYSGDTWTVTDKEGVQYVFGTTTQARQLDVNNSSKIYTWMLETITDSNNNAIAFTYYKDAGQIYPSTISQDSIVTVIFNRSATYGTVTYASAFGVNTGYHISSIVVGVNGNTAYTYSLTQGTTTDLLESIALSSTSTGATTVFTTVFEYDGDNTNTGWNSSTYTNLSYPGSIVPQNSSSYLHVDVNGDGLADHVRAFREDDEDMWNGTSINTGSGFSSSVAYTLPDTVWLYDESDGTSNMQLTDINGDGFSDIIKYGNYATGINYYLNTGAGWSTSTYTNIGYNSSNLPNNNSAFLHVDVNGDGLADQVSAFREVDSDVWNNTKLNTGNGFGSAGGYTLPDTVWLYDESDGRSNMQLADVNGDRLLDLVQFDTSANGINYYLNTGNGWATTTFTNVAYHGGSIIPDNSSSYLHVDVNGDGLADQVSAFREDDNDMWNNTALRVDMGFESFSGYDLPDTVWLFDEGDGRSNMQLADVNGDGSSGVGINYYLNKGKEKPILSKITNQYGGETRITYSTPQVSHSSNDIHFTFPTVASVTTNDLNGVIATTTYTYKEADFYYASTTDKRFAGFGNVTKISDLNKETTYFHQGNSSTTSEPIDEYARIGKVYRNEVSSLSGNIYKLTRNNYATTSMGSSSTFIKNESTVVLDYDGDGDHRDSATAYTYNDSNGSLLTQTEYGEVSANSDGTFTDALSDKRTTQFQYATSSSGVVALSQETLLNAASTTIKETKHYYDNQSHGVVTIGNKTKQEDLIKDSTYATTKWNYNGYGNVTSVVDPRNSTTTYTYDSQNLYIATTTDPLNHTTFHQYDYFAGKIGTTTDANNGVSVIVYDTLGRPLIEKIPDPITEVLTTKTEYTYVDTPGSVRILKTNHLSSATSTDSYTYFDGFNRHIQQRGEAEGASSYNVKDYVYTKTGLIYKESLPYVGSGSSKTSATEEDLLTVMEYDPLGRITSTTNVVGETSVDWDQWTESVTDANGNVRTFSYDGLGRLATTTEELASTTYTTAYTWDAGNNLSKLTDALGNVRNFTYDNLSRRNSVEDLHTVGDSTYGTWFLEYDANGNVSSTTDPKGQVINYTYDSLNRVLTENYLGQTGIEATYVYDTCSNGKGRTCQSVSESATTTYSYTLNGLPATTTKTISGSSTVYTFATQYDLQGNQILLKYPDNTEVRSLYNGAGQLNTLQYREPGGNWKTVIANFDYAPTGQIAYQLHGDGTYTTRTYDNTELYRLRSIVTIASTTLATGGGGLALAILEDELGLTSFNTPEVVGVVEGVELPIQEYSNEMTAASSTDTEEDIVVPEEEVEGLVATTTIDTELLSEVTAEIAPTISLEMLTTDSTSTLATSTATTAEELPHKLYQQMEGLTHSERIAMKTDAFLEFRTLPRANVQYSDANYDIEIVDMEPIEDGVAVFARAWSGENKLAFGKDGTVEIERFLIHNPPILVQDPKGEIIQTFPNPDGTMGERRLTEDPQRALLETLAHTIDVKKEKFTDEKIVMGKIGNTTSVFYPNGNTETTSFDGCVANLDSLSDWSPARSDTTGQYPDDAEIHLQDAGHGHGIGLHSYSSSNDYNIVRCFTLFDTSALPDTDVISSSTISLYGNFKADTLDDDANAYIGITAGTPVSNTAIAASDFDNVGSTEFATGIDIDSLTSSGYNNWSLNASGISAIAQSGISKFAFREGHDINNVANDFTSNSINGLRVYAADNTGTSNDPKLVVEHQAPTSTSTVPGGLQNLTFTYDNVGNITEIVDASGGSTTATTTYTYDDLYRLVAASTTGALYVPYSQTYSYTAIGNLAYKSDLGSYTYASTHYANPHAATAIASTTYAYDLNGNMASTSIGHLNTWNHRNQLTQSQGGGTASTSYMYDIDGSRVKKMTASSTTHFVTNLYEKENATTTKYIYAGDTLVAHIEGNGISTTTYHDHLDHLSSTKVITNASGTLTQVLDYYPFGDTRIEQQYGGTSQSIQYAGTRHDEETDLNLMNARYYEGPRGQFISQDPTFLAMGDVREFTKHTPLSQEIYLRDPQRFNSYSYAGNNPIKNKDPEGKDYIEVNGSLVKGIRQLNAGLKIDLSKGRVDLSYGGGRGFGLSGDVSAMYNFGDLPDSYSYITEETEFSAAISGAAFKYSAGAVVTNPGTIQMDSSKAVGVGLGGGGSVSINANHNVTLVDLSKAYNILKGLYKELTKNNSTAPKQEDSNKKKNKPSE